MSAAASDFKRGYYLAVATMIRQHGDGTIAEDLLSEFGSVDFEGIDPHDAEVLKPVADEIRRKRALLYRRTT